MSKRGRKLGSGKASKENSSSSVHKSTQAKLDIYMEETEISELLVDVMAEVYLAQPEDPRKFMADRIYTQLGLPILDPDNNHHAQIKRLQTDLEKNVKKVMEMLQEHQALKDEFAQREAELEEKNFELKKDLIYYKQLELANRANKVEAAKNISQRNVYLPKKKMLIDLPDQREDIRKKPKSPIRILNLSEPSSEDEELSKPIERKIVVEAKEVPKSTNIEITQDEEMDLDYDLMNHEALPSIQVEDDDLMDEAMMILKTDSVPEHLMELEKQLDNFCKKIIGPDEMVDGSGKVLDDFDEVTPSTVSSNVIILEDRDVSYVADFILAEGTESNLQKDEFSSSIESKVETNQHTHSKAELIKGQELVEHTLKEEETQPSFSSEPVLPVAPKSLLEMLEISFDASDEHAYCSPVRVTKTDNFTEFPKLEETLNDKTNELTGKMEKISEKEEKEEKVIHTFTYPAKLDSGFEPNYELD